MRARRKIALCCKNTLVGLVVEWDGEQRDGERTKKREREREREKRWIYRRDGNFKISRLQDMGRKKETERVTDWQMYKETEIEHGRASN
jgi:hypothetical protein